MDFDRYRVEDLPPLAPGDEGKPYAEYYYRGRAEVTDPELLDAIRPDHPMDVSEALYPHQLIDLVQPGAKPPRIGYCLLPEGVAYCCARLKLDRVNTEMRHWYMEWVYGDPRLRYQIWYPGAHGVHYRNLVMEDFGNGMTWLFQGERPSLKELGFDREPREYDPQVIKIVGRNARACPVGEDINQPRGYSSLIHLTRKLAGGGVELWSVGWTGAHIIGGKMKVMLAPGEVVTQEAGRQMCSHLIYEYATQNQLLPELYARFGQAPLEPEVPWPEEIAQNLTLR